jgi:hypothetical protein
MAASSADDGLIYPSTSQAGMGSHAATSEAKTIEIRCGSDSVSLPSSVA